MVDTPTSNYGLRTQELGTNIATWGDPNLNEVENCIDQILGKLKDIAISGDYTITSTNYVTTADNKNRGWRFTGTLASNATITVPATHTSFEVENATTGGFSLVVKTNAGTGITVPSGRRANLRCNAVNVLNAFPTHMGTTFAPTLPGDAANVSYVDTAIANASLPATAGTVLVDGADDTAGYIGTKIVGTGAASVSTSGTPGNGSLVIAVGALGLTNGGTQNAGFTAASNTLYNCVFSASGQILGPAAPSTGDVIGLSLAGNYVYTFNPNGLKVNGLTADFPLLGNQTVFMRYSGATDGWV